MTTTQRCFGPSLPTWPAYYSSSPGSSATRLVKPTFTQSSVAQSAALSFGGVFRLLGKGVTWLKERAKNLVFWRPPIGEQIKDAGQTLLKRAQKTIPVIAEKTLARTSKPIQRMVRQSTKKALGVVRRQTPWLARNAGHHAGLGFISGMWTGIKQWGKNLFVGLGQVIQNMLGVVCSPIKWLFGLLAGKKL